MQVHLVGGTCSESHTADAVRAQVTGWQAGRPAWCERCISAGEPNIGFSSPCDPLAASSHPAGLPLQDVRAPASMFGHHVFAGHCSSSRTQMSRLLCEDLESCATRVSCAGRRSGLQMNGGVWRSLCSWLRPVKLICPRRAVMGCARMDPELFTDWIPVSVMTAYSNT